MRFVYGKNELENIERAEENCYLIANGLGGFSSLTIAGSNGRADHTLFMAALTAPNKRYQIISNTLETLVVNGERYILSAHRMKNGKNLEGNKYLNSFSFEYLPEYVYKIGDVEVIKTVVMKHGENTLGVKYQVICYNNSSVSLEVIPLLQFSCKGQQPDEEQAYTYIDGQIESKAIKIHEYTDGKVLAYEDKVIDDLYYARDEVDGRNPYGRVFFNHTIEFKGQGIHYVTFSTENVNYNIDELIRDEKKRQDQLVETAGLKDDTANCLAKAANQYVTYRESTKGMSILAGFPFFEDWGRDTMIAMTGCTLATRQYDIAKNIFRTFMQYCHKGIMPNLFPEGKDAPMYNTVDASLLFIGAVYEYYKNTKDEEFVCEAYPVIEDIISWYMKGTDFHIKMNEDGLISAGGDLEQVTWMDVRVNDILPTPRHGKPVEINAYWYNDLMVAAEFSDLPSINKHEAGANYRKLAQKVKESFIKEFWNDENGCLNDLSSGTKNDTQIRCNQIWAASQEFCMLTKEQAHKVISKVFEELYTPVGLRSLSPKDEEFHGYYGGPQEVRDMAYHQGTVWAFPLGAYYLAYLKWADDKKAAAAVVRRQLDGIRANLHEGCIGQIAEIYDGLNPTVSKGCFAQAWSVGEILRVYAYLEEIEK